jgi:(+)-trans-carveol dehydrogenase
MGRTEGKVALITGAARGQGRSHAVRLAEEGSKIVALDICEQIESVPYAMASAEDLAETERLVGEAGGEIVTLEADIRDAEAMREAVATAVERFGRLDVVSTNAGIWSGGPSWELSQEQWDDMLAVNLTGTWNTLRAAIPTMIELGNGGSIVITGSSAGEMGPEGLGHYSATKAGVASLARTLCNELGRHGIRVNTVLPTSVDTAMFQHETMYAMFDPASPNPTREDVETQMRGLHTLPIPWVEAIDISNAVVFLASDEARYVTGIALPVDAGALQQVGQHE